MNNIDILKQNNQSIWIDYISKEIIESGELKSLINKGITGLTSNPSIFEKAISNSESYDEDIKFDSNIAYILEGIRTLCFSPFSKIGQQKNQKISKFQCLQFFFGAFLEKVLSL